MRKGKKSLILHLGRGRRIKEKTSRKQKLSYMKEKKNKNTIFTHEITKHIYLAEFISDKHKSRSKSFLLHAPPNFSLYS